MSVFVPGFKRKEFRGKLAIAITANFINRNTTAEAKVEEISGVAFIFNQKFFLDLKEETGEEKELFVVIWVFLTVRLFVACVFAFAIIIDHYCNYLDDLFNLRQYKTGSIPHFGMSGVV